MERSLSRRGLGESALALSGPATIAECAQLRLAILGAMARDGGLRLDLAGSGPWDLAGVQVVIAAVKSARAEGRAASLQGVPDVFREIVEKAACTEFLSTVIVDGES